MNNNTTGANASAAASGCAAGITASYPARNMEPASWEYGIATGVLLVVLAFLAVIGNLVVMAVLLAQRQPYRSASSSVVIVPANGTNKITHQVFILNLTFTHLLSAVLCMPLEVYVYLSGGRWTLGDAACKAFTYINAVLITSAVTTLCNIAIERFYSAVYPLTGKLTRSKRMLMLVITWCYALACCLLTSFTLPLVDYRTGGYMCALSVMTWGGRAAERLVIAGTVLNIFLPMAVTCVAYLMVWRAFRTSQRRVHVGSDQGTGHQQHKGVVAGQQQHKMSVCGLNMTVTSTSGYTSTEKRLLKTLLLMIFSFWVLWAPAITARLLWVSGAPLSGNLLLTAVWMSRMQPLLDAVIYGYLNSRIRQYLRRLVRLNVSAERRPSAGGYDSTIRRVGRLHARQHRAPSLPEVVCTDPYLSAISRGTVGGDEGEQNNLRGRRHTIVQGTGMRTFVSSNLQAGKDELFLSLESFKRCRYLYRIHGDHGSSTTTLPDVDTTTMHHRHHHHHQSNSTNHRHHHLPLGGQEVTGQTTHSITVQAAVHEGKEVRKRQTATVSPGPGPTAISVSEDTMGPIVSRTRNPRPTLRRTKSIQNMEPPSADLELSSQRGTPVATIDHPTVSPPTANTLFSQLQPIVHRLPPIPTRVLKSKVNPITTAESSTDTGVMSSESLENLTGKRRRKKKSLSRRLRDRVRNS